MLGLEDLFGPKKDRNAAPEYEVPPRKIVAIEHPCVVNNPDNALQSFGPHPDFQKLMDGDTERVSLPLWLRPNNKLSKPIMSHNASSNNVVLKITVPKRTGRKRKRGSNEPFVADETASEPPSNAAPTEGVCSVGRRDDPKSIIRRMQDNPKRYKVEAVGSIKDSHRYRGLADFQFAAQEFPYLMKVADHLQSMNVSKLREFKFEPGLKTGPGQEIIPPPNFTDKIAPYNYFYEQNATVRPEGLDQAGKPVLVSQHKGYKLSVGHYLAYNHYPVPTAPHKSIYEVYKVPDGLIPRLQEAFEERPIWTRRSLSNRIGSGYSENAIKIAIQAVGYQFKKGPWRDAVLKYGVDPRSDPKYRVYQTLAFKLHMLPKDSLVHQGQVRPLTAEEGRVSHMWDGERYATNGKFWQICDITDPSLLKLISEAPLRDECEISRWGWWHAGTIAKIKGFMSAKMIAIKANRMGSDTEALKREGYLYNSVLLEKLSAHSDIIPPNKQSSVNVPSLLFGMEDVEGLEGIRYRYRPRHTFQDPYQAMGFGQKPFRKRREHGLASTEGGTEASPADGEDDGDDGLAGELENWDSDAVGDGNEVRREGAGTQEYTDDAWAHILDSDLSGDSGDSDDDGMLELEEGDGGENPGEVPEGVTMDLDAERSENDRDVADAEPRITKDDGIEKQAT